MIVNTMNVDEVCHELLLEYDAVVRRGLSLMRIYEQEMNRKHITHTTKLTEYLSPRHNHWLILLMHEGHVTDGSPTLYQYNENGMMSYSVSHFEKRRRVIIQNGHFFKRYNERMKLNLTKPIDILKHYMKYNNIIQPTITNEGVEDKRIVLAEVYGGAALGYFIPEQEYLCMKTFVTHDMLHKTQRNILEAVRSNDAALLQQFENTQKLSWEQIRGYVR